MEEGWLLRIMGLWTAEVILISSSCIRLAKNTINGYGSPRVSAGGKRVELSLRLRKLFRIKKKRAPKIARNYLYHVLYLWGLYVAALIAALILNLVFHSENEILTEIISLLFFLQFVPLVAETVWIIVKAPIQFVRFIRKQYEKRRDRKSKGK